MIVDYDHACGSILYYLYMFTVKCILIFKKSTPGICCLTRASHMTSINGVPVEVIFGWLASFFTTLILLPQIIKAITTRRTRDVSMSMLVLSAVGNGFWVLHASITGNIPLLVGASLICLMSLLLVAFKLSFDRNG